MTVVSLGCFVVILSLIIFRVGFTNLRLHFKISCGLSYASWGASRNFHSGNQLYFVLEWMQNYNIFDLE